MTSSFPHIIVYTQPTYGSGRVEVQLKEGVTCNCHRFVQRTTAMWCRHIASVVETMGSVKLIDKSTYPYQEQTVQQIAERLIPSVDVIPTSFV